MIMPIFQKLTRLVAVMTISASVLHAAEPVDTVIFGDANSEKTHSLVVEHSDMIIGGLGEPARRLLPLEPQSWEGGKLSFKVKVDPQKQNYATLRLWGGEANPNFLILYIDGKQVGYRHLGDVEILDLGAEAPVYNGRFYYRTNPLPLNLTKNRTELSCEIRSTGAVWGYGSSFDKYQQQMKGPTRGIYRLYTHTDGFFTPPADEKQGEATKNPPVRKTPGPEMLDQAKERVSKQITFLLQPNTVPNQMELQLLAKAYHVKWTPAYQKMEVVDRVLVGMDALFIQARKDPTLVQDETSTPNPEWFGFGPMGRAIVLLAEPLKPLLDQPIKAEKGAPITRRVAYTEMLVASREYGRHSRRQYTNQSMIKDLYSIYLPNRGVAILDPSKAMPEEKALRYLYESVGLQPWLGSDTRGGSSEKPLGDNYYQLTDKGLTKELGYVGNYGEVIDWVSDIYDATRPAPGQSGDQRIRQQLIKIADARAVFRYPMLDDKGNRAMRIETVIGWRDTHYPGDITYGQRPSRDASAMESARDTLDANLIGYAQQMIDDNQFFGSIAQVSKEKTFRTTAGLLDTSDDYETVEAQKHDAKRLPMTFGQPDFVFSDEEDGVVAVKNGGDIFYASLYWRARNAINFLGRVHYLTPDMARIAVVQEGIEFEPSGMEYTRPDWTNMGFGNGGMKYPGDFHSALAGERLPIAKVPQDVKFTPGQESVYAGRGSFYKLRYGPYLVGMNMTKDKTYELEVPEDAKSVKELGSKRSNLMAGAIERVGPHSTAVLYLAD
jgi:hypothetical protein